MFVLVEVFKLELRSSSGNIFSIPVKCHVIISILTRPNEIFKGPFCIDKFENYKLLLH